MHIHTILWALIWMTKIEPIDQAGGQQANPEK